MDLTVCVCVRDGAAHVDRCLGALLAETAPYGTAIVVVDHLSRDQTPELLGRWAQECPEQVRVFRFEGEGLGAARDFAWRQCGTPWVAFVDIDCQVQPGWARAAHAAILHHTPDRHCGGFGGTNRVPRSERTLYRAYSVILQTYVGGHDSLLNRAIRERRQIEHCPTLNVVYRREAVEAVGGFDPAYTRVCEDIEVSRRLLAGQYTLWTNPDMAVDHALRPTLRSWLRNMFLYGRGRTFHFKRHPREFHPKFLAPAAVALACAAVGFWDVWAGGIPFRLTALAVAHFASIAALVAGEARRQRQGLTVWMAAAAIIWLTHLIFGAGLLYEVPRRSDKFVH